MVLKMLDSNATGDVFSPEKPAPKHVTLKYCRDLGSNTLHIVLDIPNSDLLSITYDEFTRLLISDCEKSMKIADKLLMLEHIIRLIEIKFEE